MGEARRRKLAGTYPSKTTGRDKRITGIPLLTPGIVRQFQGTGRTGELDYPLLLSYMDALRDAACTRGLRPRFVIPGYGHFLDHADYCRLPLHSAEDLSDAVAHMMMHGLCACWSDGRHVWVTRGPHSQDYLDAHSIDEVSALTVYGDALLLIQTARSAGVSRYADVIGPAILEQISDWSVRNEVPEMNGQLRPFHAFITMNRELWPLPDTASLWTTVVTHVCQDTQGRLGWGQSEIGFRTIDMVLTAVQCVGGSILLALDHEGSPKFGCGLVVDTNGDVKPAPTEMLESPTSLGIQLPALMCDPCHITAADAAAV